MHQAVDDLPSRQQCPKKWTIPQQTFQVAEKCQLSTQSHSDPIGFKYRRLTVHCRVSVLDFLIRLVVRAFQIEYFIRLL
jgi:hypothetical protein